MKHLYAIVALIGLFSLGLKGQNTSSGSSQSVERTAPTLAFGVGTMSYFGELNTQNKLNSPLTSRLAYNFSFRQDINYFLEYELTLWTGQISANERTLERNLNFETNLYGFGLGFNYNFGNFLKEERILEPVIGVGIEVISFSAKTDLYDDNGIRYNYWSDGSIRNLPENDPNSEKSVLIQRNYTYESDIKTSDLYGLDDHNSYAIGIPVTVGANLLLNNKWTFRAAMVYHFTFTDLVDGMDPNTGNFKGDDKKDNLLYSSVSISYNFTNNKPKKEDAYEDFSTFFLDEDEDQDSINDFLDDCLGHPKGIAVDDKGCPLDGDNDNVPDYKDQELYSAAHAQVDSLGVTITDEVRDLYYIRYYDKTGNYSPIDAETNTMQVIANKVVRRGKVVSTYAVAIGQFTGDIPADLVNSILSLPDVNTYDSDDEIIVAVGRYTAVSGAISRQQELERNGINTVNIIEVDENYNIIFLDENAITRHENAESRKAETQQPRSTRNTNRGGKSSIPFMAKSSTNSQIVYRIQIGAFTKAALESTFNGLPNLVKVDTDDGYVKYYTGAYTSYEAAAKAKIDLMVSKGMTTAFIVAFKDGKAMPIHNLNTSSLNSSQTKSINSATALTDEQRQNLKFKVQIGSYTTEIPTTVLEQYMELEDVKQFKGKDKYIRYAAGSFSTYEEANAYKKQLQGQGYEGCYVVADYFGSLISAKKAKEMLAK